MARRPGVDAGLRPRPRAGRRSTPSTCPRWRSTSTSRPNGYVRSWTRRAASTCSCPRAPAWNRSSPQMESAGEEVERDPFGHVQLDKVNPGAWFGKQFAAKLGAEKVHGAEDPDTSAAPQPPTPRTCSLIKRMTDFAVDCGLARPARRHRTRRGPRRAAARDRVRPHQGRQALRLDRRLVRRPARRDRPAGPVTAAISFPRTAQTVHPDRPAMSFSMGLHRGAVVHATARRAHDLVADPRTRTTNARPCPSSWRRRCRPLRAGRRCLRTPARTMPSGRRRSRRSQTAGRTGRSPCPRSG